MSLLSQVTKGKLKQPILALIYGPDGVGKSTFGADAPRAIFLGTEKGTANLDVARFPTPQNFKEVLQAIEELRTQNHDYQTLVIDSLDWLESLVWEHTCIENNWRTIEDPGFGKGYVVALNDWKKMVGALSRLRDEKGMNIIPIAHCLVKLAKDPQAQAEYDRYQLKLQDRAAALWREFVDSVLFANFETVTHNEKSGKTRAFGDGARYLYTERRPGFDAKNRHGLPFQLPLSWQDFSEAMSVGNPEDPSVILQNIKILLSEVTDADLKAKVEKTVAEAGSDTTKLEKIQNRLRALTANAA